MKTDLNLIFEDGADPEPHEIKTGLFLRKLGYEIKFLAPKNIDSVKTPDILMDNLPWEIKAPFSVGSRTIEHSIRSASKQSPNIIIDLRRNKQPDEKLLRQIKHEAEKRTNVKRLMVITKTQKITHYLKTNCYRKLVL